MSSLFLLQYTCLLVFAMQTLVLVVSRFQVSVVNRQYEKSRWSLVAAAVLLMIHYGLQMACGFRAHSDDAGVIVKRLLKKCPTRDEAAEKCSDAGQGKLL